MVYVYYAVCGLIGAIISWLLAANYYKTFFSSHLADAEHRASTSEGKISIFQIQIDEAAADFEKLRIAMNAEREAKVRAETQLKETEKRLVEEKKMLEEATIRLTDTFKALAGDTLANSNQSFLKLAKETFDKIIGEAKGDIGKRKAEIDGLIKPLTDSLKNFDDHVRQLEKTRQEAYTGLDERMKSLLTSQKELQNETGNLVTALRNPQVRGRWGEMTLKRVVELAGMSQHCDFTEQKTVATESGPVRPDLIIHLPTGREIVVDSKVALNGYLSAVEAATENEREEFLVQHVNQFREHINKLGKKAYWEQFDRTPDFVVMFIPGESFFAAAVIRDIELIEKGLEKKVILATPTTLISLLRTVAFGWREEQIAKNAQEISNLGKLLYERMSVLTGHLIEIGKGLEKSNLAYNKAVGSIETRVLPTARRFKELGTSSGADIPLIEPIEITPRVLNAPELIEDSK